MTDGMGWYTGGLASHQGTLKLAQVSGKRAEENDKGWKKTFFFFCIWQKLNLKKRKRRKEKHNAKNILSSHAYNLTVALGYL